jgi:hypothetical protein
VANSGRARSCNTGRPGCPAAPAKRQGLQHDGRPAGQHTGQFFALRITRRHQQGALDAVGVARMGRPGGHQHAAQAVGHQHDRARRRARAPPPPAGRSSRRAAGASSRAVPRAGSHAAAPSGFASACGPEFCQPGRTGRSKGLHVAMVFNSEDMRAPGAGGRFRLRGVSHGPMRSTISWQTPQRPGCPWTPGRTPRRANRSSAPRPAAHCAESPC